MTKFKTENLLIIGFIAAIVGVGSDFLITYVDLKTALKLPLGYLGPDIPNCRAGLSLPFDLISYIAYITTYKGVDIQLKRTNKKSGK